jgi:hypothetical protein
MRHYTHVGGWFLKIVRLRVFSRLTKFASHRAPFVSFRCASLLCESVGFSGAELRLATVGVFYCTRYKDAAGAVVHMFHGGLWGGWQYSVSSQPTSDTIAFGYGGYQEARGSGIKDNHFFIENVIEELDSPGEWFFDPKANMLYMYPNVTGGMLDYKELVRRIITLKSLSMLLLWSLWMCVSRPSMYLKQS